MRASIAAAIAAFGIAHAWAAPPVQALFDAHWEEALRLFPEFATFVGDHRYGDRLTDRSTQGIEREESYWRSLQEKVRAVDRGSLSPGDRVSVDLLQRVADDR